MVKALDETFSMYEKAHPSMPWWRLDLAGVPPADAPYHDGAIRYFKEKGFWTDIHQAWNDRGVARIKTLQKAWEKAVTEGQSKGLKSKKFKEFWMEERAKALVE